MFSRLLDKALVKLEIKGSAEQVTAKADEALYPTLSFPPAPRGTASLCARCLTLLSYLTTYFGDGTDYKPLVITHSSAIRDLSHAVQMNNTTARKNTTECAICIKVFILFKAMQAHVSFEESWRTSPSTDWIPTWALEVASHEPNRDRLHVKFTATHKGGYAWGIGGFTIHPDWSTSSDASERKRANDDLPLIGPLDTHEDTAATQLSSDFSSTLSAGSLSFAFACAKECSSSHSKCSRIFGNEGSAQPEPWFPDRLIQVRRKDSGALTARLVLKSNPAHFPAGISKLVNYLSFSHCWGPPPDPTAPLGGRSGSVLTEDTLPKWTEILPVNPLPLAFRHAITICAELGFEYIWIDSLCILQDSRQDWEVQSAVMGDVYRFAFLNIAALASMSDYEGFIFARDTRVAFGFRSPFSDILGRHIGEVNSEGKKCILLTGNARLLWDFSGDIQGSTASNTPLFTRAWVYQERSLARRTLAFANTSVYWSCDQYSGCERPGWSGLGAEGLRITLHRVSEIRKSMTQGGGSQEQAQSLIEEFDRRWHATVTSYTACNLTKHTDKLVAVSSITKELADTQILQKKRYLAGLWDFNFLAQLSWITVVGEKTPPRKYFGDVDYVAPSWSWASIEAPVQPHTFYPRYSTTNVPMANVLNADVQLATKYQFGSVKAGWVRIRGVLNSVRSGERRSQSLSLIDEATGEKLWFCSDTVEGYDMVRRGRARSLKWVPLALTFNSSIECSCLVVTEVEWQRYGGPNNFIKEGDKVYRRIGAGNFGKVVSMLKPNDLVLSLGVYPNLHIGQSQGAECAAGFNRKEVGMQEFVLI